MKVSKVTCIVYRDISSSIREALAGAGITRYSVQSGRGAVLRERKRWMGLSSTTILEDDPVDVYRIYVKPRFADALLSTLVLRANLGTAGRGTAFSEDVSLDGPAEPFMNEGAVRGSVNGVRLATDLVGISCIVQRGQAAPIIRSLLEAGSVPTVTFGEGMGVRDKLGLLRIAIPAEKEIVSAAVTRYDAEQVMNILIDVGRLEQPGKGFIYVFPIHKGVANTKTMRGQRPQGASMEQIVAALDTLKGSAEWRKMEAVEKARGRRKYLRELVNFRLSMNDGKASEIVQAAMDVGAPGATIGRCRQSAEESEAGTARETSDIVVGRGQVALLEKTVSKAGLFSEEAAGLIETSAVSLACTYLGGSK